MLESLEKGEPGIAMKLAAFSSVRAMKQGIPSIKYSNPRLELIVETNIVIIETGRYRRNQ